ncbi:unnamed protein product [Pleuronectes platessa]|uniref:Uncharacterized protein n=1 Tax=Pleuronectes platessa TaxID=8262 RepID=A0A9N7YF90_PLEPL|nr:unnamed protein product [Pleuronectes platessa]
MMPPGSRIIPSSSRGHSVRLDFIWLMNREEERENKEEEQCENISQSFPQNLVLQLQAGGGRTSGVGYTERCWSEVCGPAGDCSPGSVESGSYRCYAEFSPPAEDVKTVMDFVSTLHWPSDAVGVLLRL